LDAINRLTALIFKEFECNCCYFKN